MKFRALRIIAISICTLKTWNCSNIFHYEEVTFGCAERKVKEPLPCCYKSWTYPAHWHTLFGIPYEVVQAVSSLWGKLVYLLNMFILQFIIMDPVFVVFVAFLAARFWSCQIRLLIAMYLCRYAKEQAFVFSAWRKWIE